MNSDKQKLIILTGPTSAGKSDLSIKLAKSIGCEIISADSMQVYKHMDIGTGKIRKDEMNNVKHHLLDVVEPTSDFNITVFKELADKAIKDIFSRGKIPLIVGGTGFYIQSVLYDVEFTNEQNDMQYRRYLEDLAVTKGNAYLHNMLYKIDPQSAQTIHKNNIKRMIRALEFYHLENKPISLHNKEQRKKISPYSFKYFVLSDDRQTLYQKINKRVDNMISQGLIEEVKNLQKMGCTKNMTSMQAIGYKEILEFLSDECSLEDAIYNIKINTRHYAKRQLTFFRHERDVTWIMRNDYSSEDEILDYMIGEIGKL